jgi:hypothetical protein
LQEIEWMQLPALLGKAPPALAPCFALAALAALRCEENSSARLVVSSRRITWPSYREQLQFFGGTLLLDPAM